MVLTPGPRPALPCFRRHGEGGCCKRDREIGGESFATLPGMRKDAARPHKVRGREGRTAWRRAQTGGS